ncbi:MAG: GDSL-type esterase/lipase family protein [Bacteroidota bacterium]
MLRYFICLLCGCFLTPVEAQIRVLALGNSITQGRSGFPSYRHALWEMFQAAEIEVDFVGSVNAPFLCEEDASEGFDPDHEGHWGYRIDQILAHDGNHQNCIATTEQGGLQQWLKGYTADIALIHLGTNDLFQKSWFESSESLLSTTLAELDSVISLLREDNPRIIPYLAQLIPVNDPSTHQLIIRYNQALKNWALQRQSLQSPLVLVDHYSGFDWEKDTYDGVHPNAIGAKKMASKWFTAITSPLSAAARNAQLSHWQSTVWIPERLRSANSLTVFDKQGQIVSQSNQIPLTIDLSNWQSGLYYFVFEGPEPIVRKIWR